MARKRMLEPTIWDDQDVQSCTRDERLLFIALMSLADDYGHISASPAQLRKWAFGYDDDVNVAMVKEMRDHLVAKCRNVELYVVRSQEYIWLKTWETHQDLRFRAKGQYPCHHCGQLHDAKNWDACKDAAIPEQFSPDNLAHICASTTQEPTQPLPPDYVTLDQVTLDQVTSCEASSGAFAPELPEAAAEAPNPPDPVKPKRAMDPTLAAGLAFFKAKDFKTPANEDFYKALLADYGPELTLFAMRRGAERGRKLTDVDYIAGIAKSERLKRNGSARASPSPPVDRETPEQEAARLKAEMERSEREAEALLAKLERKHANSP